MFTNLVFRRITFTVLQDIITELSVRPSVCTFPVLAQRWAPCVNGNLWNAGAMHEA
jgi:hypothetical protein